MACPIPWDGHNIIIINNNNNNNNYYYYYYYYYYYFTITLTTIDTQKHIMIPRHNKNWCRLGLQNVFCWNVRP